MSKPYVPFPAAQELGIIEDLSNLPVTPVVSAIDGLAAGHLPDGKTGLVEFSGRLGGIGAVDVVRVAYLTDVEMVLEPGETSQVKRDGKFGGTGDLVLTFPDGSVRRMGQVIETGPWQPRSCRASHRQQVGALAMHRDSTSHLYLPKPGPVFVRCRVTNDGTVIARR